MLNFDQLAQAIGERVDRGFPVPLLVLRLPEFAQIAWQQGKQRARTVERRTVIAFHDVARRVVRDGDSPAHAPGTDRFAVAMLAAARAGEPPESMQIRAALERISTALARSTGRRVETGWWRIESRTDVEAFPQTIEAALERGNRERGRGAMLATVGHELRTPLTSIRGYLETLLEGEFDPRTARRFLETARREALRLGRLVEGMLEFSMLDVSTRQCSPECDVVEQIRATIDSVAPVAAARRIRISAKLPSSARARVDGDACVHALVNLAENAVKHGREDGAVEISCSCEGPTVAIAVDDDGPGIAPGHRESIFALGVRGPGGRSGRGIGLAVVSAIAEHAGGDVRVEASSLGGARFVLRFPAG